MSPDFTILIAERNRHVRDLLRRELEGEGYGVASAKSGREILEMAGKSSGDGAQYDLLIVDDEIPDTGVVQVLESLRRMKSALPVIVHAHSDEDVGEVLADSRAVFVRKSEDTESLKAAVRKLLRRLYPARGKAVGEAAGGRGEGLNP